jgi:hypothetical protein
LILPEATPNRDPAWFEVIVHIELPSKRRTLKLKQSNWDLSNLQIQFGRRLRAIDAHPKVVSKDNLQNLLWIVE